MISEKTVFVLGAGASKTYNFPLGKELVKQIVYLCRNINRNHEKEKEILYNHNYTEGQILEFGNALDASRSDSIDEFLIRGRSEFLEFGKVILIIYINSREFINYILNSQFQDENKVEDWYSYLWNVMVRGSDFKDIESNNIKFVTFNYDRSLEYFLYYAIKNRFNPGEEEIIKLLKKFEVFHVNGVIGPCKWEEEKFSLDYKFEPEVIDKHLISLVHSFKLIYEHTPDEIDQIKNHIKSLFHKSNICVLGYGFHEYNNNFIFDKEYNIKEGEKLIYGTCFNIPKPKFEAIVYQNLKIKLNLKNFENESILTYLQKYLY